METITMSDMINQFTTGKNIEGFIQEHYEKMRTLIHTVNKDTKLVNALTEYGYTEEGISIKLEGEDGLSLECIKGRLLETQTELESSVDPFTIEGTVLDGELTINISLDRKEEEYY